MSIATKNFLFKYIINIFNTWKNYINLNKSYKSDIKIFFYAEHSSDWEYLDPIVEELSLQKHQFIRITSDENDSYLKNNHTYYIGLGTARTFFFKNFKGKLLVLTLTDLGLSYIKKSIFPTSYFYVFHSIVSSHRVYNEHAFDAYDTIFCVGPHHIEEIRKTEEYYNLKKKKLVKHGYGKLDRLLNKFSIRNVNNQIKRKKHVLIAPTWGKTSINFEEMKHIIKLLINKDYNVTLRLHPMTLRRYQKKINKINDFFKNNENYDFDKDLKSSESILDADIMISDFSGAALDFAFLKEKPVIFIDKKPKTNNKNWDKINSPCLEINIRSQIGKIVTLDNIDSIPEIIGNMITNKKYWSGKIINIREKYVYNIGNSGKVAANEIIKFVKN